MTTLKAKTAGSAMVLTERDRQVVKQIADYQLLTREQLIRLGLFASKTRANATLLRLVRFGYLSRRYLPAVAGSQRALYFIGATAHQLLGAPSDAIGHQRRRLRALSDLFVAHQLLITDVRLSFQRGTEVRIERWMNDADLRPAQLGIIPDGHIEYSLGGRRFGAFVEVDRGTETLGRWRTKVQAYCRLATSGRYATQFGRQFFRVLVVTPSAVRLENLRQTTAGVTDRIFWFANSPALMSQGPFTAIWLKPTDTTPHTLMPTTS